jgi:hypothetical protein
VHLVGFITRRLSYPENYLKGNASLLWHMREVAGLIPSLDTDFWPSFSWVFSFTWSNCLNSTIRHTKAVLLSVFYNPLFTIIYLHVFLACGLWSCQRLCKTSTQIRETYSTKLLVGPRHVHWACENVVMHKFQPFYDLHGLLRVFSWLVHED